MAKGSVGSDERGAWYVLDLPGSGAGGRRRQERRRFATVAEARRALADRCRELEQTDSRSPTVERFLIDEWLPSIKASLRRSTYASYERAVVLHIVPDLGSRHLDQVTPLEVTRFYASLQDVGRDTRSRTPRGLSAKSIANIHIVLRRAFTAAVGERYVAANPCHAASRPKVRRPRMEVLRWEEVGPFIALFHGRPEQDAIALALFTGLRRGELLGLRWRDVDIQRRELNVENARLEVDGEIFDDQPKTERSHRLVPLVDPALAVLNACLGRDEARGQPSDYVFVDRHGRPFGPDNFGKTFAAHVRSERWRGSKVTLHGLRHTFASLALTQFGVPVNALSLILGHSSTAFTMDVYAHWMPNDLHAAVANWTHPSATADIPSSNIATGWKAISDDQIVSAFNDACSIRQVLLRLGVSVATKNYERLRSEAARLGLTLDHFT